MTKSTIHLNKITSFKQGKVCFKMRFNSLLSFNKQRVRLFVNYQYLSMVTINNHITCLEKYLNLALEVKGNKTNDLLFQITCRAHISHGYEL